MSIKQICNLEEFIQSEDSGWGEKGNVSSNGWRKMLGCRKMNTITFVFFKRGFLIRRAIFVLEKLYFKICQMLVIRKEWDRIKTLFTLAQNEILVSSLSKIFFSLHEILLDIERERLVEVLFISNIGLKVSQNYHVIQKLLTTNKQRLQCLGMTCIFLDTHIL